MGSRIADILLESPDRMVFQRNDEQGDEYHYKLKWNSDDARPMAVLPSGKVIVGNLYQIHTDMFGQNNAFHIEWQAYSNSMKGKEVKSPKDMNNPHDKENPNMEFTDYTVVNPWDVNNRDDAMYATFLNMCSQGRVWQEAKALSFWGEPSREQIQRVIRYFKMDDTWRIEIGPARYKPSELKNGVPSYASIRGGGRAVPRVPHVPTEFRGTPVMAHKEQSAVDIVDLILENPNDRVIGGVQVPWGLGWPFTWNGKLTIGTRTRTHMDFGDWVDSDIDGRIWPFQKVISFHSMPSGDVATKILQGLNTWLKSQTKAVGAVYDNEYGAPDKSYPIDDSWKIDMPDSTNYRSAPDDFTVMKTSEVPSFITSHTKKAEEPETRRQVPRVQHEVPQE